MNKFKIKIVNMTIEFATLQEAETYVSENNLKCKIIEFFDPTIQSENDLGSASIIFEQ